MSALSEADLAPAAFRHEALFYGSAPDFLAGTVPFLEAGLAAGEPMLVALPSGNRALLADALGDVGDRVTYIDMELLGRNPARIIPAWRTFVAAKCLPGRPVRGIGEPIWAGRTDDELVECTRHESLLNAAFDGGPVWSLLCPYDVSALPADVVAQARTTHPYLVSDGMVRPSPAYGEIETLGGDLPDPPGRPIEFLFAGSELPVLREAVAAEAGRVGVPRPRIDDLVLAVHEIAANSVVHGGGSGWLRLWADGSALVCEISDNGRITDPLVGRAQPFVAGEGGRGVWMAHQLCDLVQVRSSDAGTTVRLRVEV